MADRCQPPGATLQREIFAQQRLLERTPPAGAAVSRSALPLRLMVVFNEKLLEMLGRPIGRTGARIRRHAMKAFRTIKIPRWAAVASGPLVFLVAIPLVHAVLPWVISSYGHRYGWAEGHPALWNLFGLLPVLPGVIVVAWLLILGLSLGPELPERVELDWSPKVFLSRGPYAVSRHPMYLAEMGLWLGWTVFFGSIPVLLGCLVMCVGACIVAPREELALELKFGEAYRQYKAAVPRWLGRRLSESPLPPHDGSA